MRHRHLEERHPVPGQASHHLFVHDEEALMCFNWRGARGHLLISLTCKENRQSVIEAIDLLCSGSRVVLRGRTLQTTPVEVGRAVRDSSERLCASVEESDSYP
ncbi:hypothetical protein EWB00_001629 [Schistosoma japonicum]|uniref:Uncharacterized protein n=2 Tax=Schistosoma japonicum TaxID=6182 RepID=A0A4Z2CK32_SCHJA|nr:hypothetical protein EWB00_001629 [Schistosoma japonicum]